MEYDQEAIRNYHDNIDSLVDEFCEMYEGLVVAKAVSSNIDPNEIVTEVPYHCKMKAKEVLKELIPEYEIITALIVGVVALGLSMNQVKSVQKDMMENDPEKMMDMLRNLKENPQAADTMADIQAKQDAIANAYKNIDINGKSMKVADLGDLLQGVSYN